MFCPLCNEAWEPDYEQIAPSAPHKLRREAIERAYDIKSEQEQGAGTGSKCAGQIMTEIVYCWNGCIDEDTGWNKIITPVVIDDEDYMFCPLCNSAWEPDYEQIAPSPPHKLLMEAIERAYDIKSEQEQD